MSEDRRSKTLMIFGPTERRDRHAKRTASNNDWIRLPPQVAQILMLVLDCEGEVPLKDLLRTLSGGELMQRNVQDPLHNVRQATELHLPVVGDFVRLGGRAGHYSFPDWLELRQAIRTHDPGLAKLVLEEVRGELLLDVKLSRRYWRGDREYSVMDLRKKATQDLAAALRLVYPRALADADESRVSDLVSDLLGGNAVRVLHTLGDVETKEHEQDEKLRDRVRTQLKLNEHESGLFPDNREGRELLERELPVDQDHATWWDRGSSNWFGEYFAFWHKLGTVPPSKVGFAFHDLPADCVGGSYDAARLSREYPSLDESAPPFDAPWDKAVLLAASPGFFGDSEQLLYCATSNYGLAHKWAEPNADRLVSLPDAPSVFGLPNRLAFPAILGVHALVCTNDDYLLFCLRSNRVAYYQSTWSSSFEEQVYVGARDEGGYDHTAEDVVRAALRHEEFHVDTNIVDGTCLAIGKEFSRTPDGAKLLTHSSILAAVVLDVTMEEFFDQMLKNRDVARDQSEHKAWVGLRFGSLDDVYAFIRFEPSAQASTNRMQRFAASRNGSVELIQPGWMPDRDVVDHGHMASAPARLYLGARWLFLRRALAEARASRR